MLCQIGTLRVQWNNATNFVVRNFKIGKKICTLSVFFAGLSQLQFLSPEHTSAKNFYEENLLPLGFFGIKEEKKEKHRNFLARFPNWQTTSPEESFMFFFTRNNEKFTLFVFPGEKKIQKILFLRNTSKIEQNILSRFF